MIHKRVGAARPLKSDGIIIAVVLDACRVTRITGAGYSKERGVH